MVAANRLPIEKTEDGWAISPGGLVTALRPVLAESEGIWVGWPGSTELPEGAIRTDDFTLVPVAIDGDELLGYYQGFSNGTLWPLYHDKIRVPEFHRHWWRPYVDVNRRFAQCLADVAPEGAAVWVHDYHLSLIPGLLRNLRPDLKIGFFLHIPFPPMELFAQLPWRREILQGMLGADAVGFQTVYGARNFRAVARRYLNARTQGDLVYIDGRNVVAAAFPISIDAKAFAAEAASATVAAKVQELRASVGDRKILLGVDRLDYTKGIGHRLRAYETLLDREPERAHETVFVQIVVPSRESVAGYSDMRESIEQIAGRINGKHSSLGVIPVHYHYTRLDRADLVAHYRAADVMVVTPPRDGMNLVAKEYVASQVDEAGMLVLSEFAGAALELTQALIVNPYDLDGMADALATALSTPAQTRKVRMKAMREHVIAHDVYHWARAALEAFDAIA